MESLGRTRMNLLITKRRIEVAQRGLELLRRKREALVREFFEVMRRVMVRRERMEAGIDVAMSTLAITLGLEGGARLRSAGYAAQRDLPIEMTERNVWGVRFLELSDTPVVRSFDARGYSPTGTSTYIDETAHRFEGALELILQTLGVEVQLKKLGAEIKKATRRTNALNDVLIPTLTREAREIRRALEEREREDLFRMKRFKSRDKALNL